MQTDPYIFFVCVFCFVLFFVRFCLFAYHLLTFLCDPCSSHGQTGLLRSWCQPGSRCRLLPPLWHLTAWQALKGSESGGEYAVPAEKPCASSDHTEIKIAHTGLLCLDHLIGLCNLVLLVVFLRKVQPPGSHYGSVLQQPLLPNQMAVSAHQPINIGIAHVVWPQPASNKRGNPSQNR